MEFSKIQLAAILKLGLEVSNLENKDNTEKEFEIILQELSYFGVDINNEMEAMLDMNRQLSMNDALSLINNMSDEQRREICGFVGAIICADGYLGPNEKEIWSKYPETLGFKGMSLDEALAIYKGEDNSNIQRINFNGGYYEGEVSNGRYHGKGKIFFNNGDIKEGTFVNGKLNDRNGSYTWATGDKYVGEFKDSNMSGFGEYFYKSGDRYRGSWCDDKRNGFGVYFYADGSISFNEYSDDKCHGKSILICKDYAVVRQYSNGKCIHESRYTGLDYSDLLEKLNSSN